MDQDEKDSVCFEGDGDHRWVAQLCCLADGDYRWVTQLRL